MLKKTELYQDITAAITENSVVFPGDPVFKRARLKSLCEGGCFNLCEISLGNHMGTHIDYPAHVLANGKTSSDYSIVDHIGDGIIIDVPESQAVVREEHIVGHDIQQGDFVLFKTSNSMMSKQSKFNETYVHIDLAAARALIDLRVGLVGIDYISVDAYKEAKLPVHNILLSSGILIVENLELRDIEPGRCRVYVMPMKIPGMDGLPSRVMISR